MRKSCASCDRSAISIFSAGLGKSRKARRHRRDGGGEHAWAGECVRPCCVSHEQIPSADVNGELRRGRQKQSIVHMSLPTIPSGCVVKDSESFGEVWSTGAEDGWTEIDRKSTRLNSSHL